MPKELFKKYLPHADKLKNHESLQFLGERLHDPNLWRLNRRSVTRAFAIGLFFAWVPTPTQMALSAAVAFYCGANLPIAVSLVWLTNPVTMLPLFYFAYLVGLTVLNLPSAEFSLETVFSGDILVPFLTGCLIMGGLCSFGGYCGMQYYWHYHVTKKWAKRKAQRG